MVARLCRGRRKQLRGRWPGRSCHTLRNRFLQFTDPSAGNRSILPPRLPTANRWRAFKPGADGESRTPTAFATAPSRRRVYQFHHVGIYWPGTGNEPHPLRPRCSTALGNQGKMDPSGLHFTTTLEPDSPWSSLRHRFHSLVFLQARGRRQAPKMREHP